MFEVVAAFRAAIPSNTVSFVNVTLVTLLLSIPSLIAIALILVVASIENGAVNFVLLDVGFAGLSPIV